MRTLGLAVILSLAVTSPSFGQVRHWPSNDGWNIVQLDDSCAIDSRYSFDGRADVKISLFWDGEGAVLFLSSSDWSNRARAEYNVAYRLGDMVYSGAAQGYVDGIDKGFSSAFGAEFLDDFSRAASLYVTAGESVVTHLNLRGSGVAVATLKRCAAHVARANAEQMRRVERWNYIDRDPFSAPASEEAPEAPGTFVIVNPSWSRGLTPEFPERAQSRGIRSGLVQLRCVAAANGSVTGCTIESEEPAGVGFGQAALSAARRARLSPRTVDGAGTGATVRFPMRFEAPE